VQIRELVSQQSSEYLHDKSDEPIRKKFGEDRAIVFLVALDSCRSSNEPQIRSALAFEPPPGSAPRKYALHFLRSRTEMADDGKKGGNSPWTQAVLHELRGFIPQGVTLQEAITFVSNKVANGGSQEPIEYHITSTIPRDFCIWPAATGRLARS
jgi:hypothetical protein